MKFEIGLRYNIQEEIQELEKKFHFQSDNDGNNILVINNQRVENHFKKGKLSIQNITNELHKYLEFGLVIIINDSKNTITIYNDIYGAYPLFLESKNNKKIVRNYFDFDKSKKLNEFAIVQLIHFNHILGSNTLNKEVERIKGGHAIEINADGI